MSKFKKILSVILGSSVAISILLFSVLTIFLNIDKNNSKTQIISNEKVNNVYYATESETTGAASESAFLKGGAVFLEPNATYYMKGGTIDGHSKKYGGGIYVSNGATLTIDNGTIINCRATYGGAIYVESGGTCVINGGTIINNSANSAPAVYVESGGNLETSGEVVIKENFFVFKNYEISEDTLLVGSPSERLRLHYINYGEYPENYVGNAMNAELETWFTNNNPSSIKTYNVSNRIWESYMYTDGYFYARGTIAIIGGKGKYRDGTTAYSEQIKWFKVEPIKWLVLNYEEVLAGMTDTINCLSYIGFVSNIYFNSTPESTDNYHFWESSYLRDWLNGEFFNKAFSSSEKRNISVTTVKNNVLNNYGNENSDNNGTPTTDRIYCMSYWESYANIFDNEYQRLCSPSDFAISNFAFVNYDYVTEYRPNGGTTSYWTRSAGTSKNLAFYIGSNGLFYQISVFSYTSCLRPMMNLTIT